MPYCIERHKLLNEPVSFVMRRCLGFFVEFYHYGLPAEPAGKGSFLFIVISSV